MLDDLILLVAYLTLTLVALGVCGIALAIYDYITRKRDFSGLPPYESPDMRVQRALAAYRASGSYRGLR